MKRFMGLWVVVLVVLVMLGMAWCFGAETATDGIPPGGAPGVTGNGTTAGLGQEGPAVVLLPVAAVNLWQMLIPLLAPMVVALLKMWLQKLPSHWLPAIAIGIGAVMDLCLHYAGLASGNGLAGAALGAAGIGLREVYDQAKKMKGTGSGGGGSRASTGIKLGLLAGLLAPGLLVMGCRTASLNEGTDKAVQRVANGCELAAYMGSLVYLLDHPEEREKFEMALQSLNLMIQDKNYDPVKFRQALLDLPVSELKGESGTLVADAAVLLFDQAVKEWVDLEKAVWLKAVMIGVRDGLARALRTDN